MKTTNLRRVATMVFLSLLAIPVCGTTVEQMPSYPGGEMALLDYFQKNLQCPKEVEQAGVHGNVDVSFVIAKSGAVENVQAIKTVLFKRSGVPCQDSTLIKLCEREAVRVCQNMKKWIPGIRYGANFMVKYSMTVSFNEAKKYPCDIYDGEELFDEDYFATLCIEEIKPWYQWRDSLDRLSVTEEMKLKYDMPEGFSEDNSEECFGEYPKLRSAFSIVSSWSSTCLAPQLISDDDQFISFLEFAPIYTEEYEERLNIWFNRGRQHYSTNEMKEKHHRWKMKRTLKGYYDVSGVYVNPNDPTQLLYDSYRVRNIGDSWRDSITVYSAKEARRKWNADSAFTFSLHLRPEDYYKKVFKHVKVLLILRKGRGYACIYSFYTDKAKENFDKYWRRIERVLRFRE